MFDFAFFCLRPLATLSARTPHFCAYTPSHQDATLFFRVRSARLFFCSRLRAKPPHHILSYIHRAPNALARHAFFCLPVCATFSATRTAFFVRAIRAVYPPYFLRLLPRAKCACAFCSLIICATLFAHPPSALPHAPR